ncbi:MAG: polysaccharide biosynthesis protein [Oscillospiraceae bacterium]|nr:polysaccharide biosynthesis protein [Oscillospiraceae bacterium]
MKRVMFISSVGGHLTQMLQLKSLFNEYDYRLVTEKTKTTLDLKNKYRVSFLLHCSRKYPVDFVIKFAFNCIKSLFLFLQFRPDIIVTTGTHTAVPMCFFGWMARKKVIFIESFAKRTSPTLSGRLVYPIVSTFVVQWESMLKFYKTAQLWGWIY